MIIKVYIEEQTITIENRQSVEINTEDYPELDGMSNEEVIEYIKSNASDMKPTTDDFDDLFGELNSQDVCSTNVYYEAPEIQIEC